MGSTRRRSVGLDADPLRRAPPSPKAPLPPVSQFVKVVLDSSMETKMLKIPPRFVKSGPELSDTVTLETPCGFKQKIQLKRVDGDVWFQDGWSEFAQRHSISKGHMLLFDFRGDSSFRVLIFDMSASEVEYVPVSIHIDESNDEMEEKEEEEEEEEEEGEDKGDKFLGHLGIKEENVNPFAAASNRGSSVHKRKNNAGWIDDSDVEVIVIDEFPRTKTSRDAKIRTSDTKHSKRGVEGKSRDRGFKKTAIRSERGQSAKFNDDSRIF